VKNLLVLMLLQRFDPRSCVVDFFFLFSFLSPPPLRFHFPGVSNQFPSMQTGHAQVSAKLFASFSEFLCPPFPAVSVRHLELRTFAGNVP